MKTFKLIAIILFPIIFLLTSCNKDDNNPTQTPQNTDTVSTVSPGTAELDFKVHFQWSDYRTYNQSKTCQLRGDTLVISSSFSLMGINHYSFEMVFLLPTDTTVFLLDSNSVAYINYSRVINGFPENFTSSNPQASGNITITYLSLTRKTIKGTFEGVLVQTEPFFSTKPITGGAFKATWD